MQNRASTSEDGLANTRLNVDNLINGAVHRDLLASAQLAARPLPATKPLAARSTLVKIFLEFLKAEQIRYVFGVPGGLLHPFFEAVEQDPELRLVVAKHECGAAFMADGFARAGNGIAVAAATSGPGATNLITGVSVAFSDGVPMLIITGQAPSHSLGKGAAQETPSDGIDIVSMFRTITKYSVMPIAPESVTHHLRRAFRLAFSGKPGPVHLNIPVDYWMKPIGNDDNVWLNPETYRHQSAIFDKDSIVRAARLLLSASKPAILVGSGASSPGYRIPQEASVANLIYLAESLGALVATSPRAKGIFPEDHPQSLGVLGIAGHPRAKAFFLGEEIDVLLVVGASLNETTTLNWNPALGKGRKIIQIDIDPDCIGRNYPIACALLGDASTVLSELRKELDEARQKTLRSLKLDQTVEDPKSAFHKSSCFDSPRFLNQNRRDSQSSPLTPERWRAELSEVLPDDAIVFSDIGAHMLFNIHHLVIRRSQKFILNFGFGSMGHGTAAPIGAALAVGNRPVIAIIGDGCFSMNGMDLLTAREYQVPVIWIVENNQMHGLTWHGSKMVSNGRGMKSVVYNRPLHVDRIAAAMGLGVWRVDKPGELAIVLEHALATRAPGVIEIIVDREIAPPLADRAKAIAGFKRE